MVSVSFLAAIVSDSGRATATVPDTSLSEQRQAAMHTCFSIPKKSRLVGLQKRESLTERLTAAGELDEDGGTSTAITPSVSWVAACGNCNVTLNSGPAYRPKVGEAALARELSSPSSAPRLENRDLHMKLENKHEHDLTDPAAATQLGRVEMRS
ncbi:hypothetical protein BDP55DRAFT_625856 [Colletotrichum godetiae]|uniref:Uncharacterized protein n=1 Tax=Colletotrichum godetiae TaxID=1209918 RepID=A0AAJ0EZM3_9PEZI|nr:uncharacterized protein BDP55DRAFT_625856 [Colletotrichum godetiae]KAK1700258.1 hypothetical protein BDP55DRAFT_625856 [Colletotrichum godetiae]